MTKKFWKFVTEDGRSPGDYKPIKYTPGETIEVKDTDPRKNIQCSSGIHCLDFSDEKYNSCNIVFGPKVAILEVDEKDIIYYEKNGKCRVKKAKVLEIKEPELWMRTGNGDSNWAWRCGRYCGHHPDVMKFIIDNKDGNDAYLYAKNVSGHDERLMQVILDAQNPEYAYYYALNVLEGHDERLMQVMIDNPRVYYAYWYANDVLKGHDEKLMQVIINAQDSECAYLYAVSILKRHDEKLMQVIIDNQSPYYSYVYAWDVLKGHDERLMEVFKNYPYYKNLYEKDILKKN